MLSILLTLLGIVVLAGLVVVYVAFPHRGEDVPTAPWVGDVMRKGVELLPTLDNADGADRTDRTDRFVDGDHDGDHDKADDGQPHPVLRERQPQH